MAARKFTILDILIPAAVVGGGIFFAVKSRKKTMSKNFRLLKMKIVGINQHEKDKVMTIKILNPTSDKMEIKSFVGNVLFNGKIGGDIKMFGDYISRGNSEIEIPLVIQIRKGITLAKPVKFTGTINVNDSAIPVTLS